MSDASALDDRDIKLLRILQEDSSLPIVELCERVALSQNACWRRLKRLDSEGFIRKRVALLDPVKLGVGTTVFVTVRAAEHSDKWLDEFAQVVREIPEVVEFYRMSGDVDYLLKLQVADIAAYDHVYRKLIRRVRLSDVSSAFAMEELKHTTSIPLPL